LQLVEIDLPIGQRPRDTGPLPLEKGRVRPFRQRTGSGLTQQSVAQAKQRVGSAFSASVHLLTKLFPCVHVHLEFVPFGFVLPGTVLHQAIFCKRRLPEFIFV